MNTWRDIGEGPWLFEDDARAFAEAEVGVPWILVLNKLDNWVVCVQNDTLPEAIRAWVEREFNPKYVDRIVNDLIDVATGNRPGNAFERQALAIIMGGR
jgi:hypothetical protein